jgi:hypothetical protein
VVYLDLGGREDRPYKVGSGDQDRETDLSRGEARQGQQAAQVSRDGLPPVALLGFGRLLPDLFSLDRQPRCK